MVFKTFTFSTVLFISMLFIEQLPDKVKIAVKKPIYSIRSINFSAVNDLLTAGKRILIKGGIVNE